MTPTVMAMHSPSGSTEAHGDLQVISPLSTMSFRCQTFHKLYYRINSQDIFCSKMY